MKSLSLLLTVVFISSCATISSHPIKIYSIQLGGLSRPPDLIPFDKAINYIAISPDDAETLLGHCEVGL